MIPALRRLLARVAHALRPHAGDADADRELRAHLALLEDEFLRRGLAPDEARREARRALGGLEQARELHRDARAIRWLHDLQRDVQYACRMLRRTPGFTLIAVVSIAFGTGANVAVFSAADALLLRPLPVERPDDLLTIGSKVHLTLSARLYMSYPDYRDVASRARSFSGLIAYRSQPMGVAAAPKGASRVRVVTMTSANFFEVLGVKPQMGRGFVPDDELTPGRGNVAVLTYGMWKADFASDPDIVGKTVRISGMPFRIVGVTPEAFTGVEIRYVRNAMFVPLSAWPQFAGSTADDPLHDRALRLLTVKGRLSRAATRSVARAELAALGADLERSYPASNADQDIAAETELQVRYEMAPLDASLVAVVSVLSFAVLAVACANVAGLLASRAPVRAREIALRLAVGAGRSRLVRQLLAESLITALAGAAGGLLVGRLGIKAMSQIQYPTDVFAIPEMRLDERALWFSLALAVGSALIFGVWPAVQATRVDLADALKTSEAGSTKRLRLTGRNTLVATQVALSLVLVTISVFALDVFSRGLADGPGFRIAHMAKFSIDMSQAHLDSNAAHRYIDRALAAARALPGVQSAGAAHAMQLFGFRPLPVRPEGATLPPGEKPPNVFTYDVDESYFRTLEIPLLAGRSFETTDDLGAPRVVVVNDTFARHYWPSESAVGKRVRLSPGLSLEEGEPARIAHAREAGVVEPLAEIVGIVKTSKVGYFTEPPTDAVYFPLRQTAPSAATFVVATSGDSAALIQPLKDAIAPLNADVVMFDVQTMEAFYDARVTRIGSVVLSMIGGIALMGVVLTTIGLYGLVSYNVSRRTREMGIRIAIGATYGRLMRMVLRQGMAPAWCGIAAGAGLSVGTARLLLAIVFPLEQGFRPVRVIEIVPVLVAVTLAAAFVPARRAARVSPTRALRAE